MKAPAEAQAGEVWRLTDGSLALIYRLYPTRKQLKVVRLHNGQCDILGEAPHARLATYICDLRLGFAESF